MGTADRRVALDEIAPGVSVSTVFLGLDHDYSGRDPPILFESMVFDDYDGGEQRRYATWNDALAGHREIVARRASASHRPSSGVAIDVHRDPGVQFGDDRRLRREVQQHRIVVFAHVRLARGARA